MTKPIKWVGESDESFAIREKVYADVVKKANAGSEQSKQRRLDKYEAWTEGLRVALEESVNAVVTPSSADLELAGKVIRQNRGESNESFNARVKAGAEHIGNGRKELEMAKRFKKETGMDAADVEFYKKRDGVDFVKVFGEMEASSGPAGEEVRQVGANVDQTDGEAELARQLPEKSKTLAGNKK